MEAKLREYRAQRRRKEFIESTKETLEHTKEKVVNFLVPNIFKMDKEKNEDEVLLVSKTSLTLMHVHLPKNWCTYIRL